MSMGLTVNASALSVLLLGYRLPTVFCFEHVFIFSNSVSFPRSLSSDNIFSAEIKCNRLLMEADINDDGKINQTEYVHLLNSYTGGYFNGASFEALPLPTQATFIKLACLCQVLAVDNGNCCLGENANIAAPVRHNEKNDIKDEGAASNDMDDYFSNVCQHIASAMLTIPLAAVGMSLAPSAKPSLGSTKMPTFSSTEEGLDVDDASPQLHFSDGYQVQPQTASAMQNAGQERQKKKVNEDDIPPWRRRHRGSGARA